VAGPAIALQYTFKKSPTFFIKYQTFGNNPSSDIFAIGTGAKLSRPNLNSKRPIELLFSFPARPALP